MFINMNEREEIVLVADSKAVDDLEKLSIMVERDKNEILVAALHELLNDNKLYLLGNAIYEHFMAEFEQKDECEPFEMGGVRVEVEEYDDGKVKVKSTITSGEDKDEFEKFFPSTMDEEFESHLKNLGRRIDPHAEDTKKFMNWRFNYSGYYKAV